MCQAMGFPVILDVSPYAGAGLLGGGVPGWLPQEHPEICALGPDSQPRRDPTSGSTPPSGEHPIFLKYLKRWYQELSSAQEGWGWPDGPIVALGVNRSGPDATGPPGEAIPTDWDYNSHVIEVQWPIWLRQQYDGIDAINTAWKTDYRTVSDAAFPRQPETSEPSPRVDDAARFVAYAAAHARETYASLLREAGWTVPVITDSNAWPMEMNIAHASQVDPEPPQVGGGVRWAMDAPVRGDGSPRRQFWAVKATLLGMEGGVKPVEGGTLVAGSESRRVRLSRPPGAYGVYRLLLDGQILKATSRKRGDVLYVDYVAADEAGETDMVILLKDPSAPLAGYLRQYLVSLLMGRAGALRRAGAMCRTVAEALSGDISPVSEGGARPASEDLQAAERSLVEARLVARRAAASLGKLERLASEVRGELAPTASTLPDFSAFSPQELERLTPIRDACMKVAPMLVEAARSLSVLCQTGETSGEGLTLELYRIAFDAAQHTTREAEPALADALARLRTDLAAGALSPVAWTLQDWLTRTLQSLAALIRFR
jgi:hypothetical protein